MASTFGSSRILFPIVFMLIIGRFEDEKACALILRGIKKNNSSGKKYFINLIPSVFNNTNIKLTDPVIKYPCKMFRGTDQSIKVTEFILR